MNCEIFSKDSVRIANIQGIYELVFIIPILTVTTEILAVLALYM